MFRNSLFLTFKALKSVAWPPAERTDLSYAAPEFQTWMSAVSSILQGKQWIYYGSRKDGIQWNSDITYSSIYFLISKSTEKRLGVDFFISGDGRF